MTSNVAKDLASAGPKDLIHVDGKGRVRSPLRLRALQTLYWGALGVILVLEAVLGYGLFGPAGLSIALALTLLVAWRLSKQLALKGATDALKEQRYDEADERFGKLAASRLSPRLFRPVALGRQAIAKEKLGDDEGALATCRAAIARFGKSRHAEARLARYQEVRLLARLGQTDEAEARLEALGGCPEGELFKLHHLTTELLLLFQRGAHDLSDDELHARASFALEINLAAPLVGLLGWAFDQRGDDDMAELMRETAIDRDVDGASERYPELWAYLRGERLRVAPDEVEVEVAARRSSKKRAAD